MGRSLALTAAERARRYRQKQRAKLACSSDPKMGKQRARAQARMVRFREGLSDSAKKERALQQRNYRKFKQQESELDVSDPGTYHVGLTSPYKSLSSAGKAIVKAKAAFPKDEILRQYVWKRIGLEWGYLNPEAGDTETTSNTSSSGHLSREDGQLEQIREFFYRRDISYTTPGMSNRDHVIVLTPNGKEKLKKYYLTMYLREAYAVYREEHQDDQTSFSTFCKFRPKNVLLMKQTPQDQCLCEQHANFRFALEALDVTYSDEFWSSCLCDLTPNSHCWNNGCKGCVDGKKFSIKISLNDDVNRTIWKKGSDKRLQRVSEVVKARQVVAEVRSRWKKFVIHVNVKRIQFAEHRNDQQKINCRLLNVDFAMNFTPEPQNEIQAALWSRSSITLFTAAVEMNGNDSSMLIASSYKSKDKKAVITFLDRIYGLLPNVTDKTIQEVIWTDGAVSEFKNQYMLRMLAYLAHKFQKVFTWKFFCTAHGKGKCDAVGGKAKMVVREKLRAQQPRTETVNSARDFVRIANENLPNVTVLEVTERDIDDFMKSNPIFDEPAPYPGISKVHIVRVTPDGTITSGNNAMEFEL